MKGVTKRTIYNLPQVIRVGMYDSGLILTELLILIEMDYLCRTTGDATLPDVISVLPMSEGKIRLWTKRLMENGYVARVKGKNPWTADSYELCTSASLIVNSVSKALSLDVR
jgi:hypothetical protein